MYTLCVVFVCGTFGQGVDINTITPNKPSVATGHTDVIAVWWDGTPVYDVITLHVAHEDSSSKRV